MRKLFWACTILFALQALALPTDRELKFQEALEVILTDSAPMTAILEAQQVLNTLNDKYDLSSLNSYIEYLKKRHGGDELFRVLGFVEEVGKIGISEAIPVLIKRLEERPADRFRFLQWTQYDVEALMTIAKKYKSKYMPSLKIKVSEILLRQSAENPNNAEVITSTLYQLTTVGATSNPISVFILEQLNTDAERVPYGYGQKEIHQAAASVLVALGTTEEIVQIWEGVGIRPEIHEDVREEIATSLFISKRRTNPILLALLRKAAKSDASEKVRQAARQVVESVNLDRRLTNYESKLAALRSKVPQYEVTRNAEIDSILEKKRNREAKLCGNLHR